MIWRTQNDCTCSLSSLQSDVYCMCCKQLSDNRRNIFDERLSINSQEEGTHEEFHEHMTLKDAIELITDYTVSIV